MEKIGIREYFKELEEKRARMQRDLLRLMLDKERITIAGAARILEASIPTITKYINELIVNDYVKGDGIIDSRGGRKPTTYSVVPNMVYVVGVSIFHKDITIGLACWDGKVKEVMHIENSSLYDTANILSKIKKGIATILKKNHVASRDVLGIGISIPGLINLKTNRPISYLQDLDRPFPEIIQDQFGIPTFIENDSRAMLLAELRYSKNKPGRNALYINLSRGIGLSFALKGKVQRGKSGLAGDLGHIQTYPEGELCDCGKIGCLETGVSGNAAERIFMERAEEAKNKSVVYDEYEKKGRVRYETIVKSAREGDMFCIDLVSEMAQELGKTLSMLVGIFNPERVIIGGKMAIAGDYLLLPIVSSAKKYTFETLFDDCKFELFEVREEPAMHGAIALVLGNLRKII